MRIKVMTFNIRYDTKGDGINCFDGRKAMIKEFLDKEMPDVIGFQEVLPHIRKWLSENLTDYVVLGMGRDAKYSDEGVSIAYRKDKFDLYKFDQFWLSETPDVPGSRFVLDQSTCPRITVLATLVSKEDGKVFTFANTHLDHVGKMARACGASLLMTRLMNDNKYPFFLTGDFNDFPDSDPIQTILKVPGVKELTEEISADGVTFHNYGKITKAHKIDYIFSNEETKLIKNSLKIHTDEKDGIWLSDHYPISVIAEI